MDTTIYTLEEASEKTGLPIETLKTRIKRDKLSSVQIPYGNKRYRLGLTEQVVAGLLGNNDDGGGYDQIWAQYISELRSGIITKNRRPASPRYIELVEQCLGWYWQHSGCQKAVKNIHTAGLAQAISHYAVNEAERRDYFATRSNIFKAVTGFMRLLVREGYKSKADLEVMKELKPGKRFALKKPIYDLDQVQKAIQANERWTRGRRDYDRKLLSTLIALYAYSGLRKMEPAMLTMDKIHLEKGYLLAYGKGGVEDTVLILPALEPILREWLTYRHKNSTLLMVSYDGTPLTSTSIQTRFQRFHEATQIEIRPHDLRRTFATLAAAQGMPTPLIQKQLRHRQLRTTEGYMMINDQHLLEWGRKQIVPQAPVEQKILPAFQRR